MSARTPVPQSLRCPARRPGTYLSPPTRNPAKNPRVDTSEPQSTSEDRPQDYTRGVPRNVEALNDWFEGMGAGAPQFGGSTGAHFGDAAVSILRTARTVWVSRHDRTSEERSQRSNRMPTSLSLQDKRAVV